MRQELKMQENGNETEAPLDDEVEEHQEPRKRRTRIRINIQSLNSLVDRAIFGNWHNVIVIWGELGEGKTTLMMQMLYRRLQNWDWVLSFELEPHVCEVCNHSFDANQKWIYEVPCPECGETREVRSVREACEAVLRKHYVHPFPFNYDSGLVRQFPDDQVFTTHSSRARGTITQKYPYMNFSFGELASSIERAVNLRLRLPIIGWDDIAVYFHRSNIQYMDPRVKNFFSRYNFIRTYLANLVMTVPDPDFVPEQLLLFATADIMLKNRGTGDFDTKKKLRSFWGKSKTWTKYYDGQEVTWQKVPDEEFRAYAEIRHAHAVEAFEHPEDILVTSMPKQGREFTEDESLF